MEINEENKIQVFNIEKEYHNYIKQVYYKKLVGTQYAELKRAYFAAISTLLFKLTNDFQTMKDDDCLKTLSDLGLQIGIYFKNPN